MKKFLSILFLSVLFQNSYSFNLCSPFDSDHSKYSYLNDLSEDEILEIIVDKTYNKDFNVIGWVEGVLDFSKKLNNENIDKVIAKLIPFDDYDLNKTINRMIIKILESSYEQSFYEIQEDAKKDKYEDDLEKEIIDIKNILINSHFFSWAILSNNLNLINNFLRAGFDLNSFYSIPDERSIGVFYNVSYIHLAVDHSALNILKLLLEKGANVNSIMSLGFSPLFLAVLMDDLDKIKLLVEFGADLEIKDFEYGFTPLHLAVDQENFEIVKFLVDYGADINVRDIYGDSILDFALYYSLHDIVEYLIDMGVEISYSNLNYYYYPEEFNYLKKLLKSNLKEQKKSTDFHIAAYLGDIDKVEKFIEEGWYVGIKDLDGMSLLHLAIIGRPPVYQNEAYQIKEETSFSLEIKNKRDYHIKIINLLLDNGALINFKDVYGNTPLTFAVINGDLDLVKYLIARGANVDNKNIFNESLLFISVFNKSLDLAKYFIDLGLNVNDTGCSGETCLMRSVLNENKDIFDLLLVSGADINIKEEHDWTALHFAGHPDKLYFLDKLLKYGADTNIKDSNGKTAFDYVKELGNDEMVKFLETFQDSNIDELA